MNTPERPLHDYLAQISEPTKVRMVELMPETEEMTKLMKNENKNFRLTRNNVKTGIKRQ